MSESQTSTTTAPVKNQDTTAGNYFVSNYPPFSFWKPENAGEAFEAMDREHRPGNPLGIYLHIPFCRKRCHFCYFRVYTDKNATAINGYIEAAIRELKLYAEKTFVGGRKPSFFYFGGGTPSYLSVPQLQRLTDGLKEILPWDEMEEVTFECEPGTLNDAKLKALRDIGVTRLSLGVENFDDHILEINGRAHRSKEIERAYGYARELGFPQINIDLISGMVEETEENWKDCVQKAIALDPDSITIYQMEIPYNTTIYKEMKEQGKLVAPVADWETKRRWVKEAYESLEKVGYTVGSAYTAIKDKAKTQFMYRDRLWAGADLISLGVASFGHINGVHYQNEHNFEPYMEKLQQGEAPVFRALTPSDEERLVREVILKMKLGSISVAYYQEKFGVNILEKFAAPLKTIQDWGYLTIDGDTIRLNRDGLLQVDRLIHEFFLEQHRNARYA